jgi:hypothetical protein
MYSSIVLPPPSPQDLRFTTSPQRDNPCYEVDIIHFNPQWFPIKVECLGLWIPIVYQCLEQPHLGPHPFYGPKFIEPTSLQILLGPHISFYCNINLLMLPFPPFNHHPAKETPNFELILSKNLLTELYVGYPYDSHV